MIETSNTAVTTRTHKPIHDKVYALEQQQRHSYKESLDDPAADTVLTVQRKKRT